MFPPEVPHRGARSDMQTFQNGEPESASSRLTVRSRASVRLLSLGGVSVAAFLAWAVNSRFPFNTPPEKHVSAASAVATPPERHEPEHSLALASAPEVLPEQLSGRWLLDDGIRKEIDMRPDGTATLHVRLDLLSSLIYGGELTLELVWTLQDGVLTHTVLGGTPRKNVERLINDVGDSISYRVAGVTSQELVLEDLGAKKKRHAWSAVR